MSIESLGAVESENTKEQIAEYVNNIDSSYKSLTGRTPERIEEETGIEKELIFPPDKKTLYVGDPWQRMGREINSEKLTIIDYEYGEVASFITENEEFLRDIYNFGENILSEIEYLKEDLKDDDLEWIEQFKGLIEKAHGFADEASFYSDNKNNAEIYQKAAKAWGEAKESVEKKYENEKEIKDEEMGEAGDYECDDAFTQFRIQSWYDCVHGERGFEDIKDWNEIIMPQLERIIIEEEKKKGSALNDEETEEVIDRKKKGLIESIRLKKRVEKPNVVQGMFPELPFKDNSFDRFVASWSISAHIFDEFNEDEFEYCWQEIIRVLDSKGEAYIFPLNYYFDDKSTMMRSLQEFGKNGLFEWKIYDSDGEEVEDMENDEYLAYTLWIGKK